MRYLLAGLLACSLMAARPTPPPEAGECVECHADVDLAAFRKNSHGGIRCVQCHTAITRIPHQEKPPLPQCGQCHHTELEIFAESVHGQSQAKGLEHAPTCASCHGPAHLIVTRSNPASKVAWKNMEATCGACHPPDLLARFARLPHRFSRMGLRRDGAK